MVEYVATEASAPVILATSDLQGREVGGRNRLLGELVADELIELQRQGTLPVIDLCLLCGDFYDYPDLRKMGGTGDVTSAINALSEIASETFFVLGNHDEIELEELYEDVAILDGDVVKSRFGNIAGVSGIVGNPRKNQRKTDEEFLEALDCGLGSETGIVLLHQGPEAIEIGGRGLPIINSALEDVRDKLVVFGHAHWEQPFAKVGGNLFCNVDGRAVVFVPAPGN